MSADWSIRPLKSDSEVGDGDRLDVGVVLGCAGVHLVAAGAGAGEPGEGEEVLHRLGLLVVEVEGLGTLLQQRP